MTSQAAPFAVLTDIARRSRSLAAGLPEQQEAVSLWNGIGFMLAGKRFVAPMGEVVEILHVPRFTHVPGVQPFMLGVANVRGRLLPLIDLAQFFGLPRGGRSNRDRRILIVEQDDVFSGLVVDDVAGMQYFAEDSFVDQPVDIPAAITPFVQGGYRRDGEIWNVFSTFALIDDDRFLDVSQW